MIETTASNQAIVGVPDCHLWFPAAYPFARRAARVRATAASRRHGLSVFDREDLEQEAVLAVWRKLGLYDSGRGSLRTFAERIVENQVKSVLRLILPDRIRLQPVDGLVREPSCVPPTAAIHLRTDVRRVLAAVSRQDRELALLLAEFSPAEAGRRLGISRATAYRAVGRLRTAFGDAGLSPLEAK